MLLPTGRNHTVEGIYPQQVATQGKRIVDHRAGHIKQIDQYLVGLLVVAAGDHHRKDPAIAAYGELPVVKPGDPLCIAVLVGHIPVEQYHMRPQLAHHAVGILAGFAVIAGIATGNNAEAYTGIIWRRPERHRAAGPLRVQNHKIVDSIGL